MDSDQLELFPRTALRGCPGSEAWQELDAVFARLATSRFRSGFELRARERNYLRDRGFDEVRSHARSFIDQRLAAAQPINDGKQTPFRGHPVFLAQHATATCCRTCLSKWHGISRGKELSHAEREHVLAAIERWLASQIEPPEPGKTIHAGRNRADLSHEDKLRATIRGRVDGRCAAPASSHRPSTELPINVIEPGGPA